MSTGAYNQYDIEHMDGTSQNLNSFYNNNFPGHLIF